MSDQVSGFEGISAEKRVSLVTRFHRRRLSEMAHYELALQRHVFIRGAVSKEKLAHERLLKQPTAYQVLTLIWAASPHSKGFEPMGDWPCTQTVYGISRAIALPSELNKTVNYVDRVVDAAEQHQLVHRDQRLSHNKILVRGTSLLNQLMSDFALTALTSHIDRSGEHDV